MMRIGTAGWSIPSALAASFPAGATHLERYASVFDAVEINSSFYRPHQTRTYAKWASMVPNAFRFSVKMPKSISHEARLMGTVALLDAFLSNCAGLGDRLGALLLQLPPSLAFDARAARIFFAELRERSNAAVFLEPRHPSWWHAPARELLQRCSIDMVCADPPGAGAPSLFADVNFRYLRLHGSPEIYRSSYAPPVLDRIMAMRTSNANPDWCIFDNTMLGHAARNALYLQQRLKLCDTSSP